MRTYVRSGAWPASGAMSDRSGTVTGQKAGRGSADPVGPESRRTIMYAATVTATPVRSASTRTAPSRPARRRPDSVLAPLWVFVIVLALLVIAAALPTASGNTHARSASRPGRRFRHAVVHRAGEPRRGPHHRGVRSRDTQSQRARRERVHPARCRDRHSVRGRCRASPGHALVPLVPPSTDP
jgi:hypothetical protein